MSDDFALMFERRALMDLMPDLTPMDAEETSSAGQAMQDTPLSEDQLKLDPAFAQHAKNLYTLYEGKSFVGTDDEAAIYGIETMGSFAHNFAGDQGTLHQAAQIVFSGSTDHAKSFVYMAKQYDRLPFFSWKGFGRFMEGVLKDPTTWAGLGVGALATKGATVGISRSLTELAKQIVAAPARSAAAAGATMGGGSDIAQQAIEAHAGVEAPLEQRAAQTALSTGIGAAFGGGLVKGGEALVKGGQKVYQSMHQPEVDVIQEVIDLLAPNQEQP